MATLWDRVNDIIWNEKYWLGDDARWQDFESTDPNIYYPKISHMNWSIVVGVLLIGVRYVYDCLFSKPLANYMGLKERKFIHLAPSPPLEAAFKKYKSSIPKDELQKLIKQTDMTERQIERWLFKRRIRGMPSSMYKFRECSLVIKRKEALEESYKFSGLKRPWTSITIVLHIIWHALFYIFSSTFGLYALWDKSWLWVTVNCWVGWPKQHIDTDIYLLYLLELGFYWSLLFAMVFQRDYAKKVMLTVNLGVLLRAVGWTLFGLWICPDIIPRSFAAGSWLDLVWTLDMSRYHTYEDKKEMLIHHVVTITLIYFSWACNFVRVGSLVIVVHDVADPWLAIAKMAKYTKHEKTCEIFFAVFIISWIVSRIFVYPLWVLNASAVEIHDYVTTFPAYWFFNGLLFVLQILHVMWTYLILSIAFQRLSQGSIERDIRSESDSEISDSPDESITKNQVSNGSVQKPLENSEH